MRVVIRRVVTPRGAAEAAGFNSSHAAATRLVAAGFALVTSANSGWDGGRRFLLRDEAVAVGAVRKIEGFVVAVVAEEMLVEEVEGEMPVEEVKPPDGARVMPEDVVGAWTMLDELTKESMLADLEVESSASLAVRSETCF